MGVFGEVEVGIVVGTGAEAVAKGLLGGEAFCVAFTKAGALQAEPITELMT